MPKTLPKDVSHDDSQVKRAALLKRRQEQAADAPKAMAEYRAAQRAAIDRIQQLRALRLARDAAAAKAG